MAQGGNFLNFLTFGKMGTPYQVKKEKPIQSRQGLRSAFASRPAKSSKGKKVRPVVQGSITQLLTSMRMPRFGKIFSSLYRVFHYKMCIVKVRTCKYSSKMNDMNLILMVFFMFHDK